MSYFIPIGGSLMVICLASWQVGEWFSRLASPVARDGNIIRYPGRHHPVLDCAVPDSVEKLAKASRIGHVKM